MIQNEPCNLGITLKRTPPYGNDLEWVQSAVEKQIRDLIAHNTAMIAKKIAQCAG
jgi:hypothetical protein